MTKCVVVHWTRMQVAAFKLFRVGIRKCLTIKGRICKVRSNCIFILLLLHRQFGWSIYSCSLESQLKNCKCWLLVLNIIPCLNRIFCLPTLSAWLLWELCLSCSLFVIIEVNFKIVNFKRFWCFPFFSVIFFKFCNPQIKIQMPYS